MTELKGIWKYFYYYYFFFHFIKKAIEINTHKQTATRNLNKLLCSISAWSYPLDFDLYIYIVKIYTHENKYEYIY